MDYAISASSKKQLTPEASIREIVKKQPRSFEISEEKLALLKYKIDRYIDKKPYLNPEFNLTTMSTDTDIPIHHLSYYLNEHLRIGEPRGFFAKDYFSVSILLEKTVLGVRVQIRRRFVVFERVNSVKEVLTHLRSLLQPHNFIDTIR